MIFKEFKTHIFYIIPLLVLFVNTGDLNFGAKPCGDANQGVATFDILFRRLLLVLVVTCPIRPPGISRGVCVGCHVSGLV